MLGRRLTPVVVALGLVALAATGCSEQSAAARVGDQTLSEADLIDELNAFTGNRTLLDAIGATEGQLQGEAEGSFNQGFVGNILTQRIQFMFIDQLFDNEGFELSEDDRGAGQREFENNFGDAAGDFPQAFQDQAAEDYGRLLVLQQRLGGSEFQDGFVSLVESTEVELSSRYGTWDPEAFLEQLLNPDTATDPAIVPPMGPASAPDDGGSADGTGASDGP